MASDPHAATPMTVVPPWLENIAQLGWRLLVSAALATVLLIAAAELWTVTASTLIAVIVGATFAPFVLGLRARGWSRTRAAMAVTVGALIVAVVVGALIVLAFAPYFPEFAATIDEALLRVGAAIDSLGLAATPVTNLVRGAIQDTFANVAATAAGAVASAVTVLILAGFLTFFLLQDGDKAWHWLFQSAEPEGRARITDAGRDALDRVGGYLRGTAILAGSDALSDFVFLTLLGVPLAGPLSVLVFMGGFIPYIGGLIATIVLVIVTYSTQGITDVVILLVLITIMNVIQGNLMAPIIYGKTVNIHPALVIVALPAGAAVAGIIGLFAAIPVVAMVLAVSRALIELIDPGPEAARPAIVPGWLDRLGQWSWRVLVALGVGWLGIQILVLAPTVSLPIVLAIVLAASLLPLVTRLTRAGRRRSVAALIATGGAFLIVIILTALTLAAVVDASVATSAATGGAESAASEGGASVGWLVSVVREYGLGIVEAAAALVGQLVSLGIVVILSGLLCFYFLKDGDRFVNALLERLPRGRHPDVKLAGSKAVDVLGGYMGGTAAISAFGAGTQYVIMVILGLPLALPLAVLSFFGGFIPYVGSFITTGLAFLVTLQVGSTTDVLVMGLFTLVFNIVQGNFVAPLVYGRAVNLHPAVVLLAIPAGSEIAGVLGMFFAVPVLGVVAATWRPLLRVFATEVTPRPTPPPDATAAAGIRPAVAPDASPGVARP